MKFYVLPETSIKTVGGILRKQERNNLYVKNLSVSRGNIFKVPP